MKLFTLRFVGSIVSLGLVAAGCSSSSGGSGDFISEYCSLVAPCCAKAGLRSDGSSCRAFLGAAVGSSSYQSAQGDACLREMKAAQSRPDFCNLDGSATPSCDGAFDGGSSGGTKKPGDECDKDSDCASSTQGKVQCESTYGAGGARTSVCQLQIAGKEGDTPCGGTVDGSTTSYSGSSSSGPPPSQVYLCNVKDGVYCKSSFATGAPAPTCARIQDVDGPCDTSGSSQYACVKSAFCDFASKSCKTKLAIGASCSATGSSSCAAGSYCDNTTTGGSAICIAQLGEGAGCTSSTQCISNNCNNKKCAPAGASSLGLVFLCGSN